MNLLQDHAPYRSRWAADSTARLLRSHAASAAWLAGDDCLVPSLDVLSLSAKHPSEALIRHLPSRRERDSFKPMDPRIALHSPLAVRAFVPPCSAVLAIANAATRDSVVWVGGCESIAFALDGVNDAVVVGLPFSDGIESEIAALGVWNPAARCIASSRHHVFLVPRTDPDGPDFYRWFSFVERIADALGVDTNTVRMSVEEYGDESFASTASLRALKDRVSAQLATCSVDAMPLRRSNRLCLISLQAAPLTRQPP